MHEIEPAELVALLTSQELRIRSGIIEIPLELLGKERELAVAMKVGHCEVCEWKSRTVSVNRRLLGLRWDELVNDIESIVDSTPAVGGGIWISGVDILLAYLNHESRDAFWQHIRTTFRPSAGLILSMPRDAIQLLSNVERGRWSKIDRIANWSQPNR